MAQKHQCFDCGRWGTRAMHQLTWGTRAGQWRCDSYLACEKRRLKRWTK